VRKTGHRLKQIGTADHADDFVASEHRQPLDMSPLHEVGNLRQSRAFGNGDRRRGHDFVDPATVFVDEIPRRLAWTEYEFQPTTAASARADFTTANEIALRDNANQLACRVDDGQAADMPRQHYSGRLHDRRVWVDCNDGLGHDLVSAHDGLVSMRHKRRHRHRPQHLTRDAAEDSFLQARVPVGPHHQHVEAFVGGQRQNGGLNLGA